MYTQEDTLKIEQAMNDEIFLNSLSRAREPEKIIALFNERNIAMTIENAQRIMDGMQSTEENEELDEEQMEMVQGGIAFTTLVACGAFVLTTAVVAYITVKIGVWFVKRKYGC